MANKSQTQQLSLYKIISAKLLWTRTIPPQLWHCVVWTRHIAPPQLWHSVVYNNNFDILTICNCAVTATGNSNKSAKWELLLPVKIIVFWFQPEHRNIIDLSNCCLLFCCIGSVLVILLTRVLEYRRYYFVIFLWF